MRVCTLYITSLPSLYVIGWIGLWKGRDWYHLSLEFTWWADEHRLITAHEHAHMWWSDEHPRFRHNCSWAQAHLLIKVQCCSITRHFYTAIASRMCCRFCEKAFNRGFNLRRHEKYCPLKDQERDMSETESPTMDSEDDASTTSTRGSESPMTTDNETETEEEKRILGCQW